MYMRPSSEGMQQGEVREVSSIKKPWHFLIETQGKGVWRAFFMENMLFKRKTAPFFDRDFPVGVETVRFFCFLALLHFSYHRFFCFLVSVR